MLSSSKLLCALFVSTLWITAWQKENIQPIDPTLLAPIAVDPDSIVNTQLSDSLRTSANTLTRPMTAPLRIQYGNKSVRQHFDFYTASDDPSIRPFVLLIHGGAWVLGPDANTYESIFKTNSPQPMKNLTQKLIDNGFAVGILKYRLAKHYKRGAYPANIPTANSPLYAMMSDIDSAIRTAVANSNSLRIDVNRIGLLGESAGGYNALMYGYSNFPNKHYVKNVVSFYAPIDLSRSDHSKKHYTYQIGLIALKIFGINTNSFFMFTPLRMQ